MFTVISPLVEVLQLRSLPLYEVFVALVNVTSVGTVTVMKEVGSDVQPGFDCIVILLYKVVAVNDAISKVDAV